MDSMQRVKKLQDTLMKKLIKEKFVTKKEVKEKGVLAITMTYEMAKLHGLKFSRKRKRD